MYLVRNDYHITPDQRKEIFDEEKKRQKIDVKERQKQKQNKLKLEVAESKSKLLPDLLTRAQLLAANSGRHRKESTDANVINPPPTPETDFPENSSDGTADQQHVECGRGKLQTYEDDFLDIGCSNDMDLF